MTARKAARLVLRVVLEAAARYGPVAAEAARKHLRTIVRLALDHARRK